MVNEKKNINDSYFSILQSPDFSGNFARSGFPTVDGRNPAPVEVGSLSYYLQGF